MCTSLERPPYAFQIHEIAPFMAIHTKILFVV